MAYFSQFRQLFGEAVTAAHFRALVVAARSAQAGGACPAFMTRSIEAGRCTPGRAAAHVPLSQRGGRVPKGCDGEWVGVVGLFGRRRLREARSARLRARRTDAFIMHDARRRQQGLVSSEVFDILDYSIATPWEQVIHQIEEALRAWLSPDPSLPLLKLTTIPRVRCCSLATRARPTLRARCSTHPPISPRQLPFPSRAPERLRRWFGLNCLLSSCQKTTTVSRPAPARNLAFSMPTTWPSFRAHSTWHSPIAAAQYRHSSCMMLGRAASWRPFRRARRTATRCIAASIRCTTLAGGTVT